VQGAGFCDFCSLFFVNLTVPTVCLFPVLFFFVCFGRGEGFPTKKKKPGAGGGRPGGPGAKLQTFGGAGSENKKGAPGGAPGSLAAARRGGGCELTHHRGPGRGRRPGLGKKTSADQWGGGEPGHPPWADRVNSATKPKRGPRRGIPAKGSKGGGGRRSFPSKPGTRVLGGRGGGGTGPAEGFPGRFGHFPPFPKGGGGGTGTGGTVFNIKKKAQNQARQEFHTNRFNGLVYGKGGRGAGQGQKKCTGASVFFRGKTSGQNKGPNPVGGHLGSAGGAGFFDKKKTHHGGRVTWKDQRGGGTGGARRANRSGGGIRRGDTGKGGGGPRHRRLVGQGEPTADRAKETKNNKPQNSFPRLKKNYYRDWGADCRGVGGPELDVSTGPGSRGGTPHPGSGGIF